MPDEESVVAAARSRDETTSRADNENTGDLESASRFRVMVGNIVSRLNRFFVVLTYPVMILFTMVSLLMVITFCIFPTLLCMTFGICIYYCLMEDPIPLSVLLRYMLSPDSEETAYPSMYPFSQQRPVIQSLLIVRKVLKVDDNDTTTQNKENEYPRRHPFPITITTDSKCLHFSEPIAVEEKKEDGKNETTDDDDTPISVPEGDTMRPVAAISNTEVTVGLASMDVETVDEHPDGDVEEIDKVDIGYNHGGELGSAEDDVAKTVDHKAVSEENPNGNGSEKCRDIQSDDDFSGIHEVRDRGTACDICLLEYEVGDDVAWSPNLECTHAFHKNCVLDWLVRKPTCPNCRHDFLKGKQDESV